MSGSKKSNRAHGRLTVVHEVSFLQTGGDAEQFVAVPKELIEKHKLVSNDVVGGPFRKAHEDESLPVLLDVDTIVRTHIE